MTKRDDLTSQIEKLQEEIKVMKESKFPSEEGYREKIKKLMHLRRQQTRMGKKKDEE